MSVAQKTRHYILENILFTDDESVMNDSYSFLEMGIIDSTGILELIYFLEEEFGVKVDDTEMIPENLDSIDNIAAFVTKKRTQATET